MKANAFDSTGKQKGQLDLPADVFTDSVSRAAIYQVIRAELSNRRHGTHKVKGRAEVSGGGKKPWKQKGTGNARQGSTRAPQWRGGGTVFGPTPHGYRIDLPEKVRRAGLRSILASKAGSESLSVLDEPKVDGYSTKAVAGVIKTMGFEKAKSVVLVVDTEDEKFKKSAGNIGNLELVNVRRLRAPELYYASQIVVTDAALQYIAERYKQSSKRSEVA